MRKGGIMKKDAIPDIPEGWELRKEGRAGIRDKVFEQRVWVSLTQLAIETGCILYDLPVEKFKVPIIMPAD